MPIIYYLKKVKMHSGKRLEGGWLKVGLILCLSFFTFSDRDGLAAPDPGNPDTAYVECGGISQGALIIKIMFVTDNVGDTNKIDGFSFPLHLTCSNPAANPVLDTTIAGTYAGSAARGFSALSTYVYSNGGDPSIFPLQYNLISLNLQDSAAIGAGRYLFANLRLHLEDTTTICVDTHRTETVTLFFLKPNNQKYFPQWKAGCCQVDSADFSFPAGDANCSGNVNITDALYLANFVFKSGPAPCLDRLGDVNCSGGVGNLSDIIYLINYLFKGGPAPVLCP